MYQNIKITRRKAGFLFVFKGVRFNVALILFP